ncbi:hypothetical protein N0V87_009307 [Didymella glomerata]|uniref:SCP domain-containing protein n=1 Tax=Didymella glomerata TaxID=749621 RepID=A0A9W8WRL1_9PLEO|nr:hypothetical protein N0V87_009307 [Didymella glomerata]
MKPFATLAALLAATAVAAPAHDVKPRDLYNDDAPHADDPNFVSAVMRAHWYWRRLHCAQDLVWGQDLADAARRDITECTAMPEHMRSGSNLSSQKPAPSNYDEWIEFARTAVHGWHEEEVKYPYNNPHYDDAWGHFTQMVWRNTSRVGCAVGNCDPGHVDWPGRLYCYYDFVGNNIAAGQFQAQVWGPVCGDPSAGEATKRAEISYDWTRK